MSQHNALSIEKWQRYSKSQQILMIANELNRAGNWIKKKDSLQVKSCYERALELTQLTIDDSRWKNNIREICRFNEILAEQYNNPVNDFEFNANLQRSLITLDSDAFNLMYGENDEKSR